MGDEHQGRFSAAGWALRALAVIAGAALLLTGGCDDTDGYNALVSYMQKHQIGSDADHWIEMLNMAGEWEKTGLIFGYLGDYDECMKAIDGLRTVNTAREYRCVPAN